MLLCRRTVRDNSLRQMRNSNDILCMMRIAGAVSAQPKLKLNDGKDSGLVTVAASRMLARIDSYKISAIYRPDSLLIP